MTCTHKKSIFLLVFVLLACLTMPLAAAQEQPVQIFAQWTDDWGQPQTAPATLIPYAGYENSYWLQLPEGVTADRAALYIQDTSGMYSSFSVPNGTLLDIVLDAGIDLATAMPLEIMAFTNDGQPGPLFNLYVSAFPLPREPGAPVIMPARITVRYLDSQTFEPVATETRPTVEGGTHQVYPEPRDLKRNYQLSGDGFVTVTVDEYGAHPDVVDFYYDYVKAPVEPVDIILRYRDIDTQQEIASATSKQAKEGQTEIFAEPYDLPAGYVLESSPSAVVTVTEYGADMPELTFYYRYVKPEVKPVTVTIFYVDESDWHQVATPTTQEVPEGTWPVSAAPYDLAANYTLSGAASQDVTVNENGASANEIYFTYRYEKPEVKPVTVTIYYVDESSWQQVASPTTQEVPEGTWPVTPAPADLQDHYVLSSAPSQDVTVNENGASATEIYFTYRYEKPEVKPVTVTIYYVDESSWQQVATPTTQEVPEGTWPVSPAPFDLQEHYVLSSAPSQDVTVNENGASATEITFTYRYEKPEVKPVTVTIFYVDESTWQQVATPTTQEVPEGTWPVSPAPFDLQEHYVLSSAPSQDVTVNENGASATEITFTYRYEKPEVKPVTVTIHYVDESSWQQVASSTTTDVPEGTWPVSPAPSDLLDNYVLSGAPSYDVTVNENGASATEITFTYRYEKPEVRPVTVTIYYVDESTWQQVATPTTQEVPEGTWPVSPAPSDLLDNYVLSGAPSYDVTVNENGASATEIYFTYRYEKPEVKPVTVTIYYVDESSWQQVATPTTQEVPEGTWPVSPAPSDLLDHYVLSGAPSYDVTVNENGASATEITFTYRYEKPEVRPVTVTIYYVDESTWQQVATPTTQEVPEGTWPVSPAPNDLQEHYVLSSAPSQDVTVTENGASATEIYFTYRYEKPEVKPVVIPVLYLDLESSLPVASEQTVECQPGQITDVYANPQNLLPGYTLSSQSAAMQQVQVDEQGFANVYEVVFYYTLTPATPEPIQPQYITVSYYSKDGVQLADATTFLCQPGDNYVKPGLNPGDNWKLSSEESVYVLLDDNGLSPESVIFYYEEVKDPSTERMPVTVRYLDMDTNASLLPEEKLYLPYGDHPITAQDTLDDTYVLDGENTRIVHIDEYGANPAVVTFYYRTKPATPIVALVTIRYVDTTSGVTFYSETVVCYKDKENKIVVNSDYIPLIEGETYQLISADTVYVTVDENSVASPAEVVFEFQKVVDPTPVPITPAPTPELIRNVLVHFRTAEGMTVAPSQEFPCYVGNNTIEANPVNLLPNYVLRGDRYQTVVMMPDGTMNPGEVVFLYASSVTPAPSPFPYEYTPLDQWCYPNGNSINFRSEPYTTSRDTVIRTLKRTELCHINGELINGDGEEWYMIDVNGTKGFLKKTVVRVLSQAEVNALMGYTPVPATPSPTPIPENVPIDLWARTNKKVFFRSSMEKLNNNKIAELKIGTDVWVYHLDSMEGEQWYAVRVNGTDGYIMKEYVSLLSREESNLMPPPVPTATPIPTPYVPTPVPTPMPTATPVPTPVPTATPVPYTGYALTRYQVPLRTGAMEEAVLCWLPADSLVYVQYPHYMEGVSWSYVQDEYTQNAGYILTDALMPISYEAAIPYLQMIAQAKATPTPVPQQQTGYAETIGNNVPLRAFADTNGEILQLLSFKEVAYVRGQEFYDNATWHLVNYSGVWGYVRADQMRMLTQQEVDAYLDSLNKSTPLPTQSPSTPAPITPESLSSWGYVSSSGKVNLREDASTDSKRLRLLDNYAFAMVLGTVTDRNGDTWYYVNQAGTEGYIMGKYFKVLTLSEVTDFLQSDEYKNANSSNIQSGSNTSGQLQPWEDYNKNVWENPNISHTYEPFVPPTTTPIPNIEQLPVITPQPVPTNAPYTSPFPGYVQTTNQPGFTLPSSAPGNPPQYQSEQKQDGSALPWILIGAAVLAGGGVYAYSLHKKNERRRQAVRTQQARQAAARVQANQPQMRMAPNQTAQNTRAYQAPAAPFMPTGSGAPNGASTTTYKPVSQQTGTYQPIQPASQSQATQAYQAPAQPSENKAPAAAIQQEMAKTTAYQPQNSNVPPVPTQNGQQPPRRRRSDKYNT